MQVVYPRCCGLDVHKRSVVACVLLTREDGTVERAVRTFGTMTAELLALDDWLARLGVAHVALESTGIYWRPVFNLLEDEARTILLVNPQHLKRVPESFDPPAAEPAKDESAGDAEQNRP